MSPSVEVVLMDTDGELMKTEVGVVEFVCGAKLRIYGGLPPVQLKFCGMQAWEIGRERC